MLLFIGHIIIILLREAPWEDILKLWTFAAPSECCDWVQVGIVAYILIINVRESLIHYHGSKVLLLQPKPTVIMCFVCTKQSKSSITKVMFKQATNCYKRFLEAAKPHYANKVEEFVTFIKVDKS